MYVMHH